MDFQKGIALGVALSATLVIAFLAYEFRGMAGVALLVVAVLTWYGPRLPIFELAGNIKAD